MSTDDAAEWQREGQRVLTEGAQALTALAERLNAEDWACAVRLILSARGHVVVTGMGKSGAVGRKLAGTFSSTGTPAVFLHPAEGVHGDLGMLSPGDVVLALSYSGETDEILAILPAVLHLDIPIIALTGNSQSTLVRAAQVTLDVSVEKEACYLNLAPTTSTTAMISLGDALAVTVMAARRFTPDDYARLHPAGTLGRRLTLRVSDIMRTGEAVAVVPETATVLDTMFAMTQAHYGAAIVINTDKSVVGFIADGDIRRHLLQDQDIFARPAAAIMTPNPGVVAPDALAVEGLRLLDQFHPDPDSKVGEAPVVDAEGHPLGMLTLKDLVNAGII